MMQNLIRDIEARIEESSERSQFNEKQERWSEADFYAGKASAFGDVKILIEKTHKENEINPGVLTIADHYGLNHQLEKCKEELNELIEALGSNCDTHLAEEIADVEIMISQIKYLRNIPDEQVDVIKKYKIQRQLRRIAKENSLSNPKNCKELYDAGKDVSSGLRQGILDAMKEQSHECDTIKSPSHYMLDGLNVESIDVIKAVLGEDGLKAHCRGCTLKYLLRADKKNRTEDLKKARVYLNWEIEYGCDN